MKLSQFLPAFFQTRSAIMMGREKLDLADVLDTIRRAALGEIQSPEGTHVQTLRQYAPIPDLIAAQDWEVLGDAIRQILTREATAKRKSHRPGDPVPSVTVEQVAKHTGKPAEEIERVAREAVEAGYIEAAGGKKAAGYVATDLGTSVYCGTGIGERAVKVAKARALLAEVDAADGGA